jgi:hypothetical protein
MEKIDNSTAWFIISVLAIVLLNVSAALAIAHRDLRKRGGIAALAEKEDCAKRLRPYDELAVPAYLRKARRSATEQTR